MRDRIDAEIKTWAAGRDIKPEDLRALARRIHIVASTPSKLHAQDNAIAAVVNKWKKAMVNDPVATANAFLNQSAISYVDQKVLQWFIAEAFSAGKKARSPIIRPN